MKDAGLEQIPKRFCFCGFWRLTAGKQDRCKSLYFEGQTAFGKGVTDMAQTTENSMMPDIQQVLLSEEKLHEIVERIGRKISEDYRDKKLLMGEYPQRLGGVYGRFDAGHYHSLPY